jgi:glutathione S-transferase
MSSYQDGSRLRVPLAALRVAAPVIGAIQRRLNDATDAAANADIAALPGHLERIDAWIGDGVLGGEEPNVADLQIAATTRLLLTVEDLAPVFAGHPAREHALRVFPDYPGRVPAGVLGATRD